MTVFHLPGFWLPACLASGSAFMLQKTLADTTSTPTEAASDQTGQHVADMELGKRIKKRRQQLRLSQTALGAAVGVSFQQIQKYERGANRVSSSTLYEIAHVLETPITYFFEGLGQRSTLANCELNRKAAIREEFVATDEGQRLVDAFLAIPKKMRPKFISLLATFSREL
ncbi:helix-turn-helix domain-containing protein [Rhizobium sp. CF122]|uniref:helix-turn-helix domain-containing protein n=1 Tax=Rhizobium sp. CF122 TaxID=1144312 RepID=UPI001FCB05B9|nr:helix-turn-helix transcriptional regulator [Rhizobium sp. CF122]